MVNGEQTDYVSARLTQPATATAATATATASTAAAAAAASVLAMLPSLLAAYHHHQPTDRTYTSKLLIGCCRANSRFSATSPRYAAVSSAFLVLFQNGCSQHYFGPQTHAARAEHVHKGTASQPRERSQVPSSNGVGVRNTCSSRKLKYFFCPRTVMPAKAAWWLN
jgi:hypothetical protein